ncbi:DUF3618 domain-containing protein [Pelagibacterium luteolum]|uniref:DUF3618 domain-containing protein n=1 Tax=Pelagibacterium luteolum TaxID=440168 RepID=A0A1G8A4Z3_9HYPH|nr:DUF3618 domain-containing protein [Pelagibacterium luteolum]SDH15926.1 Protein of unknown function [Pelagibacterium luteolum]
MADQHKSSKDLERAIEARRTRIEQRVEEISARFSPGQLLDEALRYTESGPGAEFTRNLGRSVVSNPLPVAMAAASVAWLAIQSNASRRGHDNARDVDAMYDRSLTEAEEYPLAIITGSSIKRIGSGRDQDSSYTEFADTTGRKFKAPSDEHGHRAGHFTDETGRRFRGFIDEAGHQVSDFRDEAGDRFHQASGWAEHNWRKAGERVSRFGSSMRRGVGHMGEDVRHGAGYMGDRAHAAGHGLRRHGEDAVHAADDFLHQQPLVGGAIAFAIGALAAGFLPHTRQEDEYLGEASDSLNRTATREGERLYDRERHRAEDIHDEARQAVEDVYDKVKDAVMTSSEDTKPKTGEQGRQ